MENDNDYIDKLYSDKFSKFESNISTDDWAKLSSKLGKTNFLKFSFTTFNAYFLSAIVSMAAAATYMGINNTSLSKKIEKLEDKIEILQEQQMQNNIEPIILDTFAIEEAELPEQEKVPDDKTFETKPLKINKTKQLPEILKSDSTIAKIDSSGLSKTDTSTVKPKKVIRRIKKQVFIKQDKVIIKDTVKIKKQE